MTKPLSALNVWENDKYQIGRFDKIRAEKLKDTNDIEAVCDMVIDIPNNLEEFSNEGYLLTDASLFTGRLYTAVSNPKNEPELAPHLEKIQKANTVLKELAEDYDRVFNQSSNPKTLMEDPSDIHFYKINETGRVLRDMQGHLDHKVTELVEKHQPVTLDMDDLTVDTTLNQ